MNKRAALLTLMDVIKFILITIGGFVAATAVLYTFLILPVVVAWVFGFTIPGDTPAGIVYGTELMLLILGGIAVCAIRTTYLDHKERG